MSYRLQVLVPEELNLRIRKQAQRSGVSKGEWVRRAIESTLNANNDQMTRQDALERLRSINGPTMNVEYSVEEAQPG